MSAHLATAATVRVRIPSGKRATFIASRCDLDHGFVRALGRWKDRPGPEQEYAWPARRVLEIRWTREVTRAA